MKVRVLVFGVLKDWLGAPQTEVELPEGATVAALLESINARLSRPLARGVAVSVNAEFSSATHLLHDGDEVGLLPPVSGGAGDPERQSEGSTWLTREQIDTAKILATAKDAADGAVVVFDGIVRKQTRGRATLYLDYEGYEEMALRQMEQLARQARSRFGVRHVTLVHRLGRLQIGESSVLIVVASAHRAHAFEACRWIIDTLKKTVPIWKKETFADGVVWADGEPFPDGIALDAAKPPQAPAHP